MVWILVIGEVIACERVVQLLLEVVDNIFCLLIHPSKLILAVGLLLTIPIIAVFKSNVLA